MGRKRGAKLRADEQEPDRRRCRAGRAGVARGEAVRDPVSDEASCPRHDTESTGSALLVAALTRENLRQAFKRVRANKGAAGVDGLDIDQTARQLVATWPTIREQLLRGTYRPSPVRRVTIPKPGVNEPGHLPCVFWSGLRFLRCQVADRETGLVVPCRGRQSLSQNRSALARKTPVCPATSWVSGFVTVT